MFAVDPTKAAIYAVEGSAGPVGVTVLRAGEMRLPEGTVQDGAVRNQAAFIRTLQKLRAARHIRSNDMTLSVGSGAVLSRRLELPAARPRELGQMVVNEMIQVVGEASDFVYEYARNDEPGRDKTQPVTVWAYAMPRAMVDTYYSVFRNGHFKPVALDIHANCIEKLVTGAAVNGQGWGDQSVLFIQIENEGLEIHLFSEGRRVFSRFSPVSAEELLSSLQQLRGEREPAVPDELDIAAAASDRNPLLAEIVHRYVGRLADEIGKMSQFQLRRNSLNPVGHAYLYGGLARISGIGPALAQSTGIPAETVQAISGVKMAQAPVAPYLNAIGALIRL